jgi:hypothetical protein
MTAVDLTEEQRQRVRRLVEPALDAEPEPTPRTLADIDDAPPLPLLLGMIEQGPNLLYAAPGVGKGTTGAWLVRELLDAGMRPGVYDAECRPREWARRTGGLGVDRSAVTYIDPSDMGRRYAGLPITDAADRLGRIVQARGIDLLIVDSVLPALGLGEDRLRNDPTIPWAYVAALDGLGIPSVSFGHTPKGSPEGDPFGSYAWTGAMRLTWLGTRGEGNGHRVRWRPRKRNERGHIPGVLLTFAYGPDGRLCEARREDDQEATRDRLMLLLRDGAPRSVAQIVDELLEDEEDVPAPAAVDAAKGRIGKALQRGAKEGWAVKEGTSGAGVRWRLAIEPSR